jgi:hypothetical protein
MVAETLPCFSRMRIGRCQGGVIVTHYTLIVATTVLTDSPTDMPWLFENTEILMYFLVTAGNMKSL